MRTRWLLFVLATLTGAGCRGPSVDDTLSGEGTPDDAQPHIRTPVRPGERFVVGLIHGRVGPDGTHEMVFEPGEALREFAAREGVAVESLVEITRGDGMGRGANPPDTFEVILCRDTTTPLCEDQYGPIVRLGRGSEPERCGNIPPGRSEICDLYPAEIRNFMSAELSNVYVEFINLRRADFTMDLLPYGGAPPPPEIPFPMAIGNVVYRYGTLEVSPRSGVNLERPFHQASLRRWRISFPEGETSFMYVYTVRVMATMGVPGRPAPHQVSVQASGAPTRLGHVYAGCTSANQDYTVVASADPLADGPSAGTLQVYRVRRRTGEVDIVSRSTSGAIGDNHSTHPCITPDGRYVVFESIATNLVDGDTNGVMDVFVRDMTTGVTERVSIGTSQATECGSGGGSNRPAISDDGRYVAFASTCASLCGGRSDVTGCFPGRRQVYRFDRTSATLEGVSVRDGTGGAIGPSTRWGGAGTPGSAGTHNSHMGGMSGDGSRVVFSSTAFGTGYLAPSPSDTATRDVFVRHLGTMSTRRISDDRGGAVGSRNPVISRDGMWVAFETASSTIDGTDTNGVIDIIRCATSGGMCSMVSLAGGMPNSNGNSSLPSISDDGRFVAFESDATNLVGDDANGHRDVFVRDMNDTTVLLVSRNFRGDPGNGPSSRPFLSPNGTYYPEGVYLVFQSTASNLQQDSVGPFDGTDGGLSDVFAVRFR